ncbi:tRNA (guanine(9)-N(1))-methyltransferase [Coemansia nantahalensis]|uniref:tRNA (Guanine(9)-N(1))-methyltransferase n=1 Tax=Coemansia nantahalensis TaxID=2789366 RepID=A0ACC1K4M6_9FUNG|nr:tRNA (guanine(9)-N(1))-methyltransferase [Coemansia nantahalensis]
MDPEPAAAAVKGATTDEEPAPKRARPAGPSVDNFTPQTMSLEEFQKLPRRQKKKVMRQETWDQRSEAFKDKQRETRREARRRHKQRVASGETPRRRKPEEQTPSGIRVVLDMAFDDKMCDKEIKSVCSQLRRCYATNRQALRPVDLHITKLHDQSRKRLGDTTDYSRWSAQHVAFHDAEYPDVFEKQDLVYLTADSPNELDGLDPGKVYIVGGLVDKNRYPRLTLEKAEQQGIAHARLPIGQYVKMASRKVVTVNQIFEMLIKFIETDSWGTAFLDVIPQRKIRDKSGGGGGGGAAKDGTGSDTGSGGSSDNDSDEAAA